MIERKVIDQVIERAEIADVVGDFVTLHKRGQDFVGLCPFHDDTRPSFHVSVSKNLCKCFACGEGGTPLTFIMKHENLSFPEAIKYLGRKYGIEVKEKELTEEELKQREERDLLLLANSTARDAYVEALHEGSEGRLIGLSYFRERGLTDETIKQFELGYSPSNATYLFERAKKEGLEPDILEKVGLVYKSRNGQWIDRYRERIIFPIHSLSGNVVGFGGRIMKKLENVGKYINSPASALYDKSNELYGLYFAKRELSKQDRCIIVEGYMDVLWMHQRGIQNVIATSGTALTPQQALLIKRYTLNVTLIFDSDNAGINAALKGLDICLEKGLSVQVVVLPEGEDPDSFARTNDLETVQEYIKEHSIDGISFKKMKLEEQYGTGTQAKTQILGEIAETIAYIDDPIPRELYAVDIAQQIGITPQLLGQRIEEIRSERKEEVYRARARQLRREERTQQDEGETTSSKNQLQNIATKPVIAPKGRVKSTVKAPKLNHPFNKYEVTLLRYLVFNGMRFISSYTNPAHSVNGATVTEVIFYEILDLRTEGVLTPHFASILQEIIEQIEVNPSLNLLEYLTWHEDDTIRYFATELVTNEQRLSPLHKEFEAEQNEETIFSRHLLKDILAYKYAYIEGQIRKVLQKIKENSGSEDINQLLEEMANLNKIKSEMGEMLGDRILSPNSKIN
ncbi:MAG: DNA primase [Porphyromonas sp.]|nr:DNA primase [Porphyromonas sp.]